MASKNTGESTVNSATRPSRQIDRCTSIATVQHDGQKDRDAGVQDELVREEEAEYERQCQLKEKQIRQEHSQVWKLRKLFNKINPFHESMAEQIQRSRRELKEIRAQERRRNSLERHGEDVLGDTGEVRIALLGKTGIGKSLLGNNLLKKNAFTSRVSFMSVTKKCKFEERDLDDSTTLFVVDTPGLFDTRDPNEQTSKEITRSIALAAPGPHIYIFVIAVGRFTKEETDTINILQELFGTNVIDHVIIIFTRKDELGDEPFSTFLSMSPPELRQLLERCDNRYAFINNKADKDVLREEVDDILDLIYKTIGSNKGAFYTHAMYEEAEKSMKARREEIQRQKEEDLKRLNKRKWSLLNALGEFDSSNRRSSGSGSVGDQSSRKGSKASLGEPPIRKGSGILPKELDRKGSDVQVRGGESGRKDSGLNLEVCLSQRKDTLADLQTEHQPCHESTGVRLEGSSMDDRSRIEVDGTLGDDSRVESDHSTHPTHTESSTYSDYRGAECQQNEDGITQSLEGDEVDTALFPKQRLVLLNQQIARTCDIRPNIEVKRELEGSDESLLKVLGQSINNYFTMYLKHDTSFKLNATC
ncbi:hypothetical protein SNE40_000469 [Patella caerulea]|uniref:AIG1-type G domain-containing protein n=1 Tax=Patella caerulea TaxID=87958 RepID=A0AAN8KAI7_PATCE